MLKKDASLLVLILVIGVVTAFLNPRFISPINLSNTANLIGLFGLYAIGSGFVIITGGIDLSVGSLFALLGVIFVDLLSNDHMNWALAVVLMILAGMAIGAIHAFLIVKMKLQPFIVTLCGLLLYRGIARWYTDDGTAGFEFGQSFPSLEWLTTGRTYGVPHSFVVFIVVAIVMGVVLHRSVFGRYLYAVGKNEEAARYSGIRTGCVIAAAYVICERPGRPLLGLFRHVHALDLAGLARQFLRALRHRRGRARRLFAARRRRLGVRHRARRRAAADSAESRQSAGHSKFAEFRGDGWRHSDRRAARSATGAVPSAKRGAAQRRTDVGLTRPHFARSVSVTMLVDRVDPVHVLGFFDWVDVGDVDDDRFVVRADQYAFQRLRGVGVDFLMRHVRRHVDEVARAGFRHVFESVAPAHPRSPRTT